MDTVPCLVKKTEQSYWKIPNLKVSSALSEVKKYRIIGTNKSKRVICPLFIFESNF